MLLLFFILSQISLGSSTINRPHHPNESNQTQTQTLSSTLLSLRTADSFYIYGRSPYIYRNNTQQSTNFYKCLKDFENNPFPVVSNTAAMNAIIEFIFFEYNDRPVEDNLAVKSIIRRILDANCIIHNDLVEKVLAKVREVKDVRLEKEIKSFRERNQKRLSLLLAH